jgi:hypothetical protein
MRHVYPNWRQKSGAKGGPNRSAFLPAAFLPAWHNGSVARSRTLSLPIFLGVSLAVHVGSFRTLERHASAPVPAFEPPATSQTVTGETLDVESATADPAEPGDDQETSVSTAREPVLAAADVAAPRPPSRRSVPGAAPSPSAASVVSVFGAAGVRYAADLATTFTRAFPQAASADATWETAPFGGAGAADVTLVIDEEGHLASSAVSGAPSPALRQGIARTLALLAPRTFTAREAVTKIRVTARVSRDEVHDGLHGDVFALSGGSFSGDLGTAFFALPPAGGPGRRVDVQLRLLR